METEKIKRFTSAWIQAWNDHNLEVILEHYADNVDFRSPIIWQLQINECGNIMDKQVLRAYFEKALLKYPDLTFELYHELYGVNSVVLVYRSVSNSLSAEYMELNEEGKIQRVRAHYQWH
ncbi:nuclear transport factor 2 family protein [Olivibacter sp. CPCC 100613]|uniref:nuclear transport factor 2 family protein n=1 Tax=Olivibacter sp. CPCC 100613 TaxID=3079931 RepID=UPI002FF4688D